MLWTVLIFLWLSPLDAAFVAFLAGNSIGPLTATGGVLLGGAVAMISWNIGMLLLRDIGSVTEDAESWRTPIASADAVVGILITVAIFATNRGWRRRTLLTTAGVVAGLQVATVAIPLILADAERFFVLLFTAAFSGFFYPYWVLLTLFFCFFVALKNQSLCSSEVDADHPL